MFRRIGHACSLLLLTATMFGLSNRTVQAGDIIDVDLSGVAPSAVPLFRNAEKFWEDRIRGYSSELPRVLRDQLSALEIIATVGPIDGIGGTLGAAGPEATLSFWVAGERPMVVAVRSTMIFDLDDFPSLQADGILQDVIIHEMGHALGFGSLWQQNLLIEPLNGIGQTEYTNGRYGIIGYQRDIGDLTTTYVPLEQRGGPGTALGHWNDMPPFFNQVGMVGSKKEILTGFACDADPNVPGELICAPKFISNATLGAMADLGFAVDGFNGQYAVPRGKGFGPWPKVIGPGPFLDFGSDPATAGLRFSLGRSMMSTKASRFSTGTGVDANDDQSGDDPYNLRNHRWSK